MDKKLMFFYRPLLELSFDRLSEIERLNHINVILSFQVGKSISFLIEHNGLWIKQANSISTILKALSEIVEYLKENNILWKGSSTSFKHGTSLGIITVTSKQVSVSYYTPEGTKDYGYGCPLKVS